MQMRQSHVQRDVWREQHAATRVFLSGAYLRSTTFWNLYRPQARSGVSPICTDDLPDFIYTQMDILTLAFYA
jgi:hypothetical protein